jgi:hypothetical protein
MYIIYGASLHKTDYRKQHGKRFYFFYDKELFICESRLLQIGKSIRIFERYISNL